MRALLALFTLLFACATQPNAFAGFDSDGDGQTDEQEAAAGTDPQNDLSVEWKSLSAWRFDDAAFLDASGIPPLASSHALLEFAGRESRGLRLMASNGVSYVRYAATNADGRVNLSPKRGSIWAYIKTEWFTDSGGPGHWATVFETHLLSLKFNPTGQKLMLMTRAANGSMITNVTVSVDIVSLDFPPIPLWYTILVTYSPEETSVTWNTPNFVFSGPGLHPPADSNGHEFISIGSNLAGDEPIDGVVDEVVSFNIPGALRQNAWMHSALVSTNPPGIKLVSNAASNTVANVKRRVRGTTDWQTIGGVIGQNFFDATALEGVRYEYNINSGLVDSVGDEDLYGQFTGAAINAPPIENRGKLILLVDKTLTNELAAELSQFATNLVGDGWQILRADVPRHIDEYADPLAFLTNTYNITNVIKPFILSNYTAFGPEIKQILIIGHVSIPYTGTIADDGHYGQHGGAWPSDLYYGDIDGVWTDLFFSNGSFANWNWNYPGDGKFDQDFLPLAGGVRKLEVGVARVDLANLTAFDPVTETALLKRYFAKNAAFRTGSRQFDPEAMFFDTHVLGRFSEVPQQTAEEMLGQVAARKPAINADPFVDPRSAIIAAVSGPGGFDNINGLMPHEHNTAQLAAGLLSEGTAFYFIRQSFGPDWNTTNNLYRALLASTNGALASAATFSSQTWRVTGLGLGDTLGSDQADAVTAWHIRPISPRSMEIMGDATLRYPVLAPPSEVTARVTNNQVFLGWTAAPSGNALYHVYRSTGGVAAPFVRLNSTPLLGTSFLDASSTAGGRFTYMVRALAKVETGAGTFTNISQGAFTRSEIAIDPTACCVVDQTTLEDVATASFALPLGNQGLSSGIAITFESSNPALVPLANITLSGEGATRSLVITPAPERFGTSTITVTISDEHLTNRQAFTVAVQFVNDPPSFTKGPDQLVGQGAGERTVPGWATQLSLGPGERGQTMNFLVTVDQPSWFDLAPTISSAGTLRYALKPTVRGVVNVQVYAKDTGGTANGGSDTSAPQSFTIAAGLNTDANANGLPDDYETALGLNGSDGDNDGDGFTNLQEFWAGTDPRDASNLLEISQANVDSSGFRLRFSTAFGKLYTVQFNDHFPQEPWQNLFANLPGTGGNFELADIAGYNASTNRIYRVQTSDGAGHIVSSGCAGFHKIVAHGNSDTMFSEPFIRPPEARGVVQALEGNVLTISGTPPWSSNRWVFSDAQQNRYYAMVCSGNLEGDYFLVTANGTNTLTLDLDGGILAGLAPGDRIMLVPYWTFGTIFPRANGIHASPFSFLRYSEVFLPDISGSGVNLSPKRTFYFSNNAWREFPLSASQDSAVILPDLYMWVRHNVQTNTTIVANGAVLHTKFRVPLQRRNGGRQDNFVALPRPCPVSFQQLGLIESAAFRVSPFSFFRTDEIFQYRLDSQGVNRAPVDTFFYDGQWRKFAAPGAFGDAVAFLPGRGLLLRLDPATNSVMWINSPNY